MEKIQEKVSYCLNCKIKPCSKACPLGNDIPSFIEQIKIGNNRKAYEILSNTTVLESICGRICPHMSQCMGPCVRGIKSEPVSIGELEAYIGDIAIKENYQMSKKQNIGKGKKVAVIGSGPASLTCSAFLARQGFEVTIFEKDKELGGILIHGIPEFRLDRNILNKCINKIIDLGIDVRLEKELEKDIFLEELIKQYDAIFLGIGANVPCNMGIEGEELEGVYGGNLLLEKGKHPDYKGKRIAVIGGGNVAMDCARTINRLGAEKVYVIYRRAREQMPAEEKEIENAINEGVEFLFQNNIVKIIGNTDGKVEKIECIKTQLVKKEGEKRESPIDIKDSNYIIPMDYVVMAIGSRPNKELMNKLGVQLTSKGYIVVNENYETTIKNVFAGGDIIGSKATVAWAARGGREAGNSIAKKILSV